MGISILNWEPVPGMALPTPRIDDDSLCFADDCVKNVRAWLRQTAPAFVNADPTPITLTLERSGGRVEYCVGDGVKEILHFRHSTIELLLRDKKTRVIIAKYRYLAARDQYNRIIVGPQLRVIQEQTLSVN